MPYRKGSLWGYADTTGKIVVTPQFFRTDLFLDGFNFSSVVNFSGANTYLGVVKNTGEIIIAPTKFSSYELASRSFDYYGESKTYLPERLDKVREKRSYTKQAHWTDSLPVLFLARIRGGYSGKDSIYLFDSTGKQLTYEPFEAIAVFSYLPLSYNFLVKKNNKFGVVAQNGKTVIPVEYDMLNCINEENGRYVIIAQKNGKSGLITMDNKMILPIVYDTIRKEIYDYSSHFVLAIRKKKEEAVYDPNGILTDGFKPGKVSVTADYENANSKYRITREPITADAIDRGTEVVAMAKDDDRAVISVRPAEDNYSGQIKTDKTNNLIPHIYADNQLYGLKKGDSILIKPQYQSLTQLWLHNRGTYYIADENGKRGIVNQYNKIFIPVKFTGIDISFYHDKTDESFFKVTDKKGLSGIITLDNKVIVPLKYLTIEKSEKLSQGNDVIFACSDAAKTVFYKRNGDILFTGNFISAKPMLGDVDSLQQQVWMVKDKNGTAGLINNSGTYIINPVYKELKFLYASTNSRNQRFISVKNAEGKQGLCSLNGLLLLPAVYDTLFSFQNQGNYNTIKANADTIYYFVTSKDGLYGITDMWGNTVLPHKYDGKFTFLSRGVPYIIVEKNKEYGLSSFANPDLILPEKNIIFPLEENDRDKLSRGIIFYKNAAVKESNLGVFLIKDGKVFKQLPAKYKHDWGGRSSSVYRKYFSFLALDYIKDNQRFFDYIGYNGVQFFED
jgi:hypothetical protein